MDTPYFNQTIQWYNQHAHECAAAWDDQFASEQITTFVSMLPSGAKVLDAGCGTGRYTCLLAQSGLQVVGIDISEGMLAVARSKHQDLHFEHGNFLQLPYPENMFDGVWAHNSLVHLETIDQVKTALNEFKRVLKSEGILHLLLTCQQGSQKTGIEKDTLHPEGIFYQYFSKDEVHQLLNELRYKIIVLEEFDESERYPNAQQGKKWIHTLAQEIKS